MNTNLENFNLNYSYHVEGEKVKEKINNTNNFFEFYLLDVLDEENYPIIRYNHDLGKKLFNKNEEIEFLASQSFLRIRKFFKDYPESLI